MLAIEYYRMLKDKYPDNVHKSKYIYIYTNDGVVENVLFRFRKGKGKKGYVFVDDMPKEKLMLKREAQGAGAKGSGETLPKKIMIQVRFAPLEFVLFDY